MLHCPWSAGRSWIWQTSRYLQSWLYCVGIVVWTISSARTRISLSGRCRYCNKKRRPTKFGYFTRATRVFEEYDQILLASVTETKTNCRRMLQLLFHLRFQEFYNSLSTTRRICSKYGEIQTGMYFFFVYTGTPVLWAMSVNNFHVFNNISESI